MLRPTISVICLALVFLASIFALAEASQLGFSKLIYGDGKVFQTSLVEARLLGQLPIPTKEPILVFSGRPAVTCTRPNCNEGTSVYWEWASYGPNMWNGRSFRYPADYYDLNSKKLLAHVRMFIGQCADSREGIVWFIDSIDRRARQSDSALQAQTELDYVLQISGMESPALATEYPANLDIAMARAAVSKKVCKEIPPRARLYVAEAEYVLPLPKFRTDCSTPVPIDMPLGQGRPGASLSYQDSQTNIVLNVEGDGRHLTAVNSGGQLLWRRDPFVDRNLCPYRTARPIVVYVGPLRWSGDEADVLRRLKISTHLVEIRFDSSQFGVVDINNGDFFFAGQN
jgi:hypothetical protein